MNPGHEGRLVAGLDVGTSKVSLLVGICREQEIEVVSVGKGPSFGLKKGVVVDIPKTVESIVIAVREAEKMVGRQIVDVFVGIAGSHISCLNSKAAIEISAKAGLIDESVKEAAINAAIPPIPVDKELIHVIPIDFCIDGLGEVSNPVGLYATSLEAEIHSVLASTSAIKNIVKCVELAGLRCADIVLEPLASGMAVLSEEEKEAGVALIDIGGGTTDIAVFSGGKAIHSHVFPVGGNHLTNDISVGLGISRIQAEKLKKEYAVAIKIVVDDLEMVPIAKFGEASSTVSRACIAEIVESRVTELFRLVENELRSLGFRSLLPAGLVLTGGSSKLPHIEILASEIMGLQARLGAPLNTIGMKDIIDDPIFATGVGLVRYGGEEIKKTTLEDVEEIGFAGPVAFERLVEKIKSWFADITR